MDEAGFVDGGKRLSGKTRKGNRWLREQIVELSPMARLLFIATWCEADKEGRMAWKPRTIKIK